MIKKILSFLLAICLFAIILYLGFKASTDNSFVIWFGLASTFLAPIGFALIGYTIKKDNEELLTKLSKVTEIDELFTKAKTQEEKIKVLEVERNNLEDTIKYEVLRSILIEKKTNYEVEAEKLITNLDDVKDKLLSLDKELEEKIDNETIQRLRERIKTRETDNIIIKIGNDELIINVVFIRTIPMFGEFIVAYIKLFQDITIFINKLFKSKFITKQSSQ